VESSIRKISFRYVKETKKNEKPDQMNQALTMI